MRLTLSQIITVGFIASAVVFAAPAAFAKTAAECDADYAANKAAIKASGQTKKDYVAACRAGTVATTTA